MTASQIDLPLTVPVCAWCKPKEWGSTLGALSHGICPRHLHHLKLQMQGLTPKRSPRPRRRRECPDENLLFR
ncbi:MAG TPA: hypothetical protein VNT26_19915 [Candidatus Sulfotelmatobacter sp.]|nr:hypothetical protein [Candidatus Sulfotelmatobacter sp.]HWI57220.1 hypothetical protein [Bacillota bacterium]